MKALRLVGAFVFLFGAAQAATYDPASDFAVGWSAGDNPNGVWSYGYAASPTGALTLYSARVVGADSSQQMMWISPEHNCCSASPSVGFNNGPAFDDGNVAQAANEVLLVSSVSQNLATELVFTAPRTGSYSLQSSFVGDQRGVGVGVDVVHNGSILFSSSVTRFQQVVSFGADVTLTAGDTLAFVVTQGPGSRTSGSTWR